MTLSQVATLGKLSAECPHCQSVGELSRFATFYGERSGLAVVECQCGNDKHPGCGGKWRRVEVAG